MGYPPPPDAPPEAEQALVDASLSFEAGPPISLLCGFKIPFWFPKFSLHLPDFGLPPKLPKFSLSISISCDLNNPLNISASLGFGGERKPLFDPDPDLAE